MKRLFNATVHSLRALGCGIKGEAAIREEAGALVLAVPVGVFAAPGPVWYVAMIAVLLVLLAVEFVNTAIEKLADHVTPVQHPEIRLVKDYGSAAVFCVLCLAVLVWLAAIAARVGLF